MDLKVSDVKADLGIFLCSALLDMFLFGLVAQQYYTYWTGGFKDRIYLVIFVNVQFALVTVHSILTWHLAFQVFVVFADMLPPATIIPSAQASSMCQLVIILLSNIFLVIRIRGMTKSLVQSLTPLFFSIIAFVFGIVTIATSKWGMYPRVTTIVWYVSQTAAECLISIILVRALLKARSGMQRSNSVVRYLVRNSAQTAALASIWAIGALVSWFWLKHIVLYTLFDRTSATVYTHAIFDTLLSRPRLRDRMAATSVYVDLGCPSSTQSQTSMRFPDHVVVSSLPAQQSNSGSEPGTPLADKDDIIEQGNVPPGVPYTL